MSHEHAVDLQEGIKEVRFSTLMQNHAYAPRLSLKVGIRPNFRFVGSSGFLHRCYSMFLPFQFTERIF